MDKEGAGAHPGWCNVMCTIKKLGLDCLVGFSFFFISHSFWQYSDSCDAAELFCVKTSVFLFLVENKTILQNGPSPFAWPAKILDVVQKLPGQALGDCIRNGGGESK